MTHVHLEVSDSVAAINSLVRQDDIEGTEIFFYAVRPVAGTLGPPVLLEIGHHDNGRCMQLPHQTPEVYYCALCWSWKEWRMKGREGWGWGGGGGGGKKERERSRGS